MAGVTPNDDDYESSKKEKVAMNDPISHINIKVKCRMGFVWNDPNNKDE